MANSSRAVSSRAMNKGILEEHAANWVKTYPWTKGEFVISELAMVFLDYVDISDHVG
jgi:hypothetical protein